MAIENHENSDLADLEMETKPEDVLAEIERLQQSALSSVHSAERSPLHELKLNEQPLNIYEIPCCQEGNYSC
jgi:hypothetical protein